MAAHEASDFKGKVAIINGGTRGLGREIALKLARLGANVVVTGRTKLQGEQVVEELAAHGGVAIFVQMDGTKEAEIVTLHEAVVARFGSFDFAVFFCIKYKSSSV